MKAKDIITEELLDSFVQQLSKKIEELGIVYVDGKQGRASLLDHFFHQIVDAVHEQKRKEEAIKEKGYMIKLDGDNWCATRDDFVNLQKSVAGFGNTPEYALERLLALENFQKNK